MCFSCLCKRNLIIKAKNPLGNVCPFISLAVFHLLLSDGLLVVLDFFLGGGGDCFCLLLLLQCTMPIDKADTFCLTSLLQCPVPVLCWWNVFSLFLAVLLHPLLSVAMFYLLEIHWTWSCSDEFAWLGWAFWDRPTAQQLLKKNKK